MGNPLSCSSGWFAENGKLSVCCRLIASASSCVADSKSLVHLMDIGRVQLTKNIKKRTLEEQFVVAKDKSLPSLLSIPSLGPSSSFALLYCLG